MILAVANYAVTRKPEFFKREQDLNLTSAMPVQCSPG